MKTLLMDEDTKDLVILKNENANTFEFIDGEKELIQRLRHRLELFKGDFFLQSGEGIDYFSLFEKPVSLEKLKSEMEKALKKDSDVYDVADIDFKSDRDRKFYITFEIITKSGTINLSETMVS